MKKENEIIKSIELGDLISRRNACIYGLRYLKLPSKAKKEWESELTQLSADIEYYIEDMMIDEMMVEIPDRVKNISYYLNIFRHSIFYKELRNCDLSLKRRRGATYIDIDDYQVSIKVVTKDNLDDDIKYSYRMKIGDAKGIIILSDQFKNDEYCKKLTDSRNICNDLDKLIPQVKGNHYLMIKYTLEDVMVLIMIKKQRNVNEEFNYTAREVILP